MFARDAMVAEDRKNTEAAAPLNLSTGVQLRLELFVGGKCSLPQREDAAS